MTTTSSEDLMPHRFFGSRRAAALVLAAATMMFAGCSATADSSTSTTEPTLSGVTRTPAPDVGDLSLPDVTNGGKPFQFRASQGKVLVLYFGYTSCPDVCPTTLADLKAALKKLGPQASAIETAMATIDPKRDTADVVSGYIRSFVPTAVALRSDDAATLDAATSPLGVSFTTDYSDPANPEVAHSGYLYAIDDTGHLVVQWAFGTKASDIAADLKLVLARTSSG